MTHLETLIAEYLEWSGYLVRKNVKVGRLNHGGWEMELDVLGFHPHNSEVVHYEPSLDASSWKTREERYQKKMDAGRKYVFSEIFPWLPKETVFKQYAIFPRHGKDRTEVAGAKIIAVDTFVQEIVDRVKLEGLGSHNAIAESYPLLRTIQITHNGYSARRAA